MQKINNSTEDFLSLNRFLGSCIDIKDDEYKNEPMSDIIFSYMIIPDAELLDNNSIIG